MEGQNNRAIGLWESWHQKQNMLESVFGSGAAAELDKEKFQFLSAGMARITPGASADEKLVLAMLKKTTDRLEKQLYPNPVLRVLRRLKSLLYDRPVQAAKLKKLKSENILSLSRDLSHIGVNPDKLNLDKRLDFESPRLDISLASPYGTDHNFEMKLHLEKDQSGAYELQGYTAELKNPLNAENSRSYTFPLVLQVNAREAANLLQGRAVQKFYPLGENGGATKWLQLDFEKLTGGGKPQLKEMGADYEFSIRQQLRKVGAALDKPELDTVKAFRGLAEGSQVALKQATGEVYYLEASPMTKDLLVRNAEGKATSLEAVAEVQQKLYQRKPKTLKLDKSRTQKKQQGQSLGIS